MKKIFGLVLVILILLLASITNACEINTANVELEARVSGNYESNISAEDNDEIDIKLSFRVEDISGTDCATSMYARARIYTWDRSNEEWDLEETTSSERLTLEEDDFEVTWYNEFTIDDREDRYRIEGYVTQDNNRIVDTNAYVNVVENSCSGINLITHDFTMDEGKRRTRTFRVENNTNKNFEITNAEILFSTTMFESANITYNTLIRDGESENVEIEFEAKYFSNDKTAVGTFLIQGELDGETCSSYDIGRENFEATIEDIGSNNSGSSGSGTSSDCDEIEIKTKNITINENDEIQEIFYLENNSTKRFEILEVKTIDSGVRVESYYFEKYAFPGTIADIVINIDSANITNNITYENELQVKGKFSDGRTCEFDDIYEGNFLITVENTNGASFADCQGLSILANDTTINGYGQVPFTITNNTNKRAIIYVQGANASPSEIVLPANSAISREITISTNKEEEKLIFNPQVEGCNTSLKTILITNTAKGELTQISINTRIESDEDNSKLIVEFENLTSKTFVGVLTVNANGQTINDEILAIPSGTSFAEIMINDPSSAGTITFTADGKTISTEFGEDPDANLAGLFILGGNLGTLGAILLIILVVAIIVILITNKENQGCEENWVN